MQKVLGFNFELVVEDKNDFGLNKIFFSKVSGFETSISVSKLQEPNSIEERVVLPGFRSYRNITCIRGMTDSKAIYDWIVFASDLTKDRRLFPAKNITVYVYDKTFSKVEKKFFISKAFPVSYKIGALDSSRSEIVMEQVVFAHSGWKLISA